MNNWTGRVKRGKCASKNCECQNYFNKKSSTGKKNPSVIFQKWHQYPTFPNSAAAWMASWGQSWLQPTFGSAPWFRRNSTQFWWPSWEAISNGVARSAAWVFTLAPKNVWIKFDNFLMKEGADGAWENKWKWLLTNTKLQQKNTKDEKWHIHQHWQGFPGIPVFHTVQPKTEGRCCGHLAPPGDTPSPVLAQFHCDP